jgi:hypothetical protein
MRLNKSITVLICIAVLFACGCGNGGDTQKQGGLRKPSIESPVSDTTRPITIAGHSYALQESDDIPLSANVVSDYTLNEIGTSIGYYSQLSQIHEDATITGINRIAPVKELRGIKSNDGYDGYYCIFEKQTGGRLYVFFRGGELGMPYALLYAEKQLAFDDFSPLKKGMSTKEDVAKIDPSAASGILQVYGGFNGQSQPNKTFHMTEEGYVIIAYTKKGVVKKISMEQDGLIQSINKKDLAGG